MNKVPRLSSDYYYKVPLDPYAKNDGDIAVLLEEPLGEIHAGRRLDLKRSMAMLPERSIHLGFISKIQEYELNGGGMLDVTNHVSLVQGCGHTPTDVWADGRGQSYCFIRGGRYKADKRRARHSMREPWDGLVESSI